MEQRMVSSRQAIHGLVVIEDKVPSRFGGLAAVAGDATPLENRLDVAVIFDVEDGFCETQTGLVLDVPLLAGLIVFLGGQKRSLPGQIENLVIGPGSGGVLEVGRLLAVGVAAATV